MKAVSTSSTKVGISKRLGPRMVERRRLRTATASARKNARSQMLKSGDCAGCCTSRGHCSRAVQTLKSGGVGSGASWGSQKSEIATATKEKPPMVFETMTSLPLCSRSWRRGVADLTRSVLGTTCGADAEIRGVGSGASWGSQKFQLQRQKREATCETRTREPPALLYQLS